MPVVNGEVEILEHSPVPTWFGVGGGADRLCRPGTPDGVAESIRIAGDAGWAVRVLGDGANLLVLDGGVDGLVIDSARLDTVELDGTSGLVRVGAGVRLFDLINAAVRAGLGGLEVLAGIPARMGGAVAMNAGGRFGSIADTVRAIEGVDVRTAETVRLARSEIDFGYRRSGLGGIAITAVELGLEPGDRTVIRDRQKECMAYKKRSQPLAADSAGCCFKNPTLDADLDGIGAAGERVSAGMLIDRSGCKGLRIGGAEVSGGHANFLITEKGASADDVVGLMDEIERRVHDRFGVRLEREVVVWGRGS